MRQQDALESKYRQEDEELTRREEELRKIEEDLRKRTSEEKSEHHHHHAGHELEAQANKPALTGSRSLRVIIKKPASAAPTKNYHVDEKKIDHGWLNGLKQLVDAQNAPTEEEALDMKISVIQDAQDHLSKLSQEYKSKKSS